MNNQRNIYIEKMNNIIFKLKAIKLNKNNKLVIFCLIQVFILFNKLHIYLRFMSFVYDLKEEAKQLRCLFTSDFYSI
jgi:hypothetical protein